jgi:hypothetical protein
MRQEKEKRRREAEERSTERFEMCHLPFIPDQCSIAAQACMLALCDGTGNRKSNGSRMKMDEVDKFGKSVVV